MKVYDFRYEIGQIIGNVSITNRFRDKKTSQKKYEYKCNVCGNTDEVTETSVKRALENNTKLCSTCCGIKVKEGINDIPTTDPWIIPYFQGGYDEAKLYSHSSHKRVNFRCPDCGRIKSNNIQVKSLYDAHSISCGCGDGFSYPEKFMFNLLEQLNYEFITQYSPDWIKPYRYDFYLPNRKLIIEVDGGLGHGHVNNLNNNVSSSMDRDNEKDKKAFEHYLQVKRINSVISTCAFMKDSIVSSGIFTENELARVDFTLCDSFACSNRCKTICEFYENNKPITTSELSEKFKLHQTVVWKYLCKGTEFGWCDYDGKNIMQNNGESRRKQIVVIKDDKELNTYSSALDLVKNSEKDFGIKFTHSKVTAVARDELKQHKGYKFKYI